MWWLKAVRSTYDSICYHFHPEPAASETLAPNEGPIIG